MSRRILIADPDPEVGARLARELAWNGYEPRIVRTGAEALAALHESTWNLVISETSLPGLRGSELCMALRAEPATREVPILFLSARAEEIDRVVAFETGADDFVPKPFSMRELLLRIAAVTRRRRRTSHREEPLAEREVRLDPSGHLLMLGARRVHLSPTELSLLAVLLAHPKRVLSREELVAMAWGQASDVQPRAVDTIVKRVRRKLGDFSPCLATVWREGFRWLPPELDPGPGTDTTPRGG